MTVRFTADQARKAVEETFAPYLPGEVYERIKKVASAGRLWAVFEANRWDDSLTDRLVDDGYGVRFARLGEVVLVTWGNEPRKLMEGGGNDG